MQNPKFQKTAIRNRTIAIVFTVAFHVIGIYALTNNSETSMKEMLPEFVQDWIGGEDDNKTKKEQLERA